MTGEICNRYLVFELCQGTLADVINGHYKGAPLPSELEVLHQIADGLDHIHGKNIIHRHIKPHNILISKDSKMKLSDFGFIGNTKMDAQSVNSVTGIRGTLNWIAPELYHESGEHQTIELKEETKESDIFATGLVFFVFLAKGIHPFGDMTNPLEIASNIRKNKRINGIL